MQAPGDAPELGLAQALVQLADSKGRFLAAAGPNDLRFVIADTPGWEDACLWVLAAAQAAGPTCTGAGVPASSGSYVLLSVATGGFLSAATGQLACRSTPEFLQMYMDLDRRVVLHLAGKACLQAAPSGAALAGRLPLSRDRASKLFSLQEAGLPRRSLQAWPLRAALRWQQSAAGGYLSACGGGALAANAPVACCSEEFVLAMGEAAPLRTRSDALLAPCCALWTGDGTRLLSREPLTGQVVLAQQQGCTGGERFSVQLSGTGEVRLYAEAPATQQAQQQGSAPSSGGSSGSGAGQGSVEPAPVAVQDGRLVAAASGAPAKPTPLALELASNKPTLLLTAHGQLLSPQPPCGGDRPAGVLLPVAPAGAAHAAHAARAAERCAWLLDHHGDSVYSLRHAGTGRSLYVNDEHGTPCLEARPGTIVYPDNRLLFWVEPGWAELAAPSGTPAGTPDSSGSSGGSSGAAAAAAPGPAAATAGFVQPDGSGGSVTAAGFSIRSVHRVNGRHMYLSVLPSGLLTTVYAAGRPTRWELFTVADFQTLVHSPAGLLDRLPCMGASPTGAAGAAAAQPHAALRRTVSMQTLSGSGGAGYRVSPPALPGAAPGSPRGSSVPRLPAVQEHLPADVEPAGPLSTSLPATLGGQGPQRAQQEQQQQQQGAAGPRRSQSDTALAALEHRHGAGQSGCSPGRRPLWLAELLRAPAQRAGWGACSAASLQDLACRQLCASLAAQYRRQQGEGQLAPGLAEAVEAELSTHLPEELSSRIAGELHLLLEAPPPTKISLHALRGGAAGAPKDVPPWAERHLPDAPAEHAEGALRWQPTEAFLCACCRGASGALLPLDPYTSPRHHLFLHAMERVARGGGRVRLRARRRLDEEDLLIKALKAGKLLLLCWATARTLGSVLRSGGGGGGRSGQQPARLRVSGTLLHSSGGGRGRRRRER